MPEADPSVAAPLLTPQRLRVLLLLAVLVGTLGYVASGAVARGMMFPGCRIELRPPAPAGATIVDYATDDGLALRGLLVPGAGPAPRPALVYFHGNAESAAQNDDVARLFAARGVDVFVAEYRGYGGCPGSPSEDGLLLDGRAAVREASARTGVASKDLVLFGRSLGSGVASALAAEGHGRAVVLLSPYTSMVDMACLLVPRPLALLAVRDAFDSKERLGRAAQPVVVLHGTRDGVIPFAQGEALAAALGARATLVRLEGADHNDVFERDAARIVDETLALARRP